MEQALLAYTKTDLINPALLAHFALRQCFVVLLLLSLGTLWRAEAAIYPLPSHGDAVIGRLQQINVTGSESLATIARRYDIGIDALTLANPGVDEKQPAAGTNLTIPSRHLLPSGSRSGIVINLAEKRLFYYHSPERGKPLMVSTYPVSIGYRDCPDPMGDYQIEQRLHKPVWTLPKALHESQLAFSGESAKALAPGPKNPLGQYALKLDAPDFLIHGTNRPNTIGTLVGEGCVRLYPEDIRMLIQHTHKGVPVRIVNEWFKSGEKDGILFMEFHKPRSKAHLKLDLRTLTNRVTTQIPQRLLADDWRRIRSAASDATGYPAPVAHLKAQQIVPKLWWLELGSFKRIEEARARVLQAEALGLPISVKRCDRPGQCRALAGPFSSLKRLNEVSRKMLSITRLRGTARPFHAESIEDEMALAQQQVAVAQPN